MAEKLGLNRDPSGEAMQPPISRDYAMARDEERDRIGSVGVGDRPDGRGAIDFSCEATIGPGLTGRYLA